MPAKNISFNTPNHAKFIELMKATGKPTRQAAIADVLRNAARDGHTSLDGMQSLSRNTKLLKVHLDEKTKLEQTINNYRWIVVVLATVAIAGWIL